ncbi:hypothetical protein MTR67_001744 [Solanum verrucosum]|uniref:RNase H type-1 domain-containing protein n=1 Tax=Solanum verrucosum TaxID=315347 RepID=A0AAF0PUV0_SOLVR|nr:hypothetical protein MTR67_001744 [Solanum verrucosum]
MCYPTHFGGNRRVEEHTIAQQLLEPNSVLKALHNVINTIPIKFSSHHGIFGHIHLAEYGQTYGGITDANNSTYMKKEMKIVEFSMKEQMSICRIVASVMIIGNINDNVFRENKHHVDASHVIASATEYHLLNGGTRDTKKQRTTIKIRWEPLVIGQFKLNTNGAAGTKPGEGGIGGVIRDHNGNWVNGFWNKCSHVNVQQVDLLGILFGLRLAMARNLKPLVLNTDSTNAISMIEQGSTSRGGSHDPWWKSWSLPSGLDFHHLTSSPHMPTSTIRQSLHKPSSGSWEEATFWGSYCLISRSSPRLVVPTKRRHSGRGRQSASDRFFRFVNRWIVLKFELGVLSIWFLQFNGGDRIWSFRITPAYFGPNKWYQSHGSMMELGYKWVFILAGVVLVATFMTVMKIFVGEIISERFSVSRRRFDRGDYGEEMQDSKDYVKKVDSF